tara:strand:- start:628 stop:1314 length:687 start_codon:yes stop_codon:yes gene_type:complete
MTKIRQTIAYRAQTVLSERKEYQVFGSVYVYIKDPLPKDINMTTVISQVEQIVPIGLAQELEAIYIGQFPELVSREVKAVYKDATIYMTNEQDSEEEVVDDIIHEIAHSVESFAGMEIYSDGFLEREFVEKRKKLLDILHNRGYNIDVIQFLDTEYSKELDYFFYKGVGYDKMAILCIDIFPTPYSATSLREYFAVGLEEFLYGDKESLKSVSPVLYQKISNIISYFS